MFKMSKTDLTRPVCLAELWPFNTYRCTYDNHEITTFRSEMSRSLRQGRLETSEMSRTSREIGIDGSRRPRDVDVVRLM